MDVWPVSNINYSIFLRCDSRYQSPPLSWRGMSLTKMLNYYTERWVVTENNCNGREIVLVLVCWWPAHTGLTASTTCSFPPLSSIRRVFPELGNKTVHRTKELWSMFWILVPDGSAPCCRISWNAGFFVLKLRDKEKPKCGCEAFNSSDVLHRGIPEEGSSGEPETRRTHVGAAGRARSFMSS